MGGSLFQDTLSRSFLDDTQNYIYFTKDGLAIDTSQASFIFIFKVEPTLVAPGVFNVCEGTPLREPPLTVRFSITWRSTAHEQ